MTGSVNVEEQEAYYYENTFLYYCFHFRIKELENIVMALEISKVQMQTDADTQTVVSIIWARSGRFDNEPIPRT